MLLGLGGPNTLWGGFGTGEYAGREGLPPDEGVLGGVNGGHGESGLEVAGVGCGASELKGGSGREEGEPYESKFEYPSDKCLFKRFTDFSNFQDLMDELLRILRLSEALP